MITFNVRVSTFFSTVRNNKIRRTTSSKNLRLIVIIGVSFRLNGGVLRHRPFKVNTYLIRWPRRNFALYNTICMIFTYNFSVTLASFLRTSSTSMERSITRVTIMLYNSFGVRTLRIVMTFTYILIPFRRINRGGLRITSTMVANFSVIITRIFNLINEVRNSRWLLYARFMRKIAFFNCCPYVGNYFFIFKLLRVKGRTVTPISNISIMCARCK